MTPTLTDQPKSYANTVALILCLGSFAYGFNSAIIGSVIGQPSWQSYFNVDLASSYGSSIIGAVNGLYAGAGIVGCLSVFQILDKVGRLRSIQIASVACLVSAALQTASVHITMFLVGRLLNGFSVAWINCTVPTYVAEISQATSRGRIVGAHGYVICAGYAIAGWCGFGTYYLANANIQWRLLVSLQCVAPLLLLFGTMWIPESPRWLIHQGRDAEGLNVLKKLYEDSSNASDDRINQEFQQIRIQLALEREQEVPSGWQILMTRVYRRRLLYGFCVQVAAQSTGVLVMSNYMVIQLRNLGLTDSMPLMILAVYNSWAFIMNYVNAMIVDRVGRITLLVVCLTGCAVTLSIVTGLTAYYGGLGNSNKAGSAMAVTFTFLFVTFYGAGLDVTSYVYCTEIFPTHIRARGVGLSVAGLFIITTIFTTAAGPAFNTIGWKYYLVFIIITTCMVPLIALNFPETKGLALEEVGRAFGDSTADGIIGIEKAVVEQCEDPDIGRKTDDQNNRSKDQRY